MQDADTLLPWLRTGFLQLTADRDKLADLLRQEKEEDHRYMTEILAASARNFDQLARFARDVSRRRMIGLAFLAPREGVES